MIKTTLSINGMMCGMCESHINDTIRKNFIVKKVNSSRKKKQSIIISDNYLDENKIKEVINATGYELINICSEVYEKKGLF